MISTIFYLIFSILWLAPGSVIIASGQGQMTDIKVLPKSGDGGQCPSMEERERAINEIHQIVDSVVITTASIATMTGTCTSAYTCNGTPGWRRVAFINMTDTSYNCPTGLNLTSYSKRTCGQSHTTSGGCSSTIFSVGDLPYSQVCGRIRGYQFGETVAFFFHSQGIDSYYIDGVSLTHGNPGSRQHIWTFAAGLNGVLNSSFPRLSCPCDSSRYYDHIPAFVGNNYFCESGLNTVWAHNLVLYPDNVLWDGQNCTSTSTCCQLNNPPWFTKNLTNATTDDIELRICVYHTSQYNDIPLELIELYVK